MKLYSEACERNKAPIADVLAQVVPEPASPDQERPLVLEVGSGTGQHAVAFARRFPHLRWQPTNQAGHLQSIGAWRAEAGLENLLAPKAFDLFDDGPPVEKAQAVVAINVIHIAPFEATAALFAQAVQILSLGDPVFLYGPFRYADRPLESSNQRFDDFLRARDPSSGIRLFEEVDALAAAQGFEHRQIRRLPANNDAIWWRLGRPTGAPV